jgi:uncharacterized repeat protein (TIGR01451 family)
MVAHGKKGVRTLARALGALFAMLFISLPSPSAAQQITFTSASASWRDAQDNLPGSQSGDPVITNGVPTSSVSWGGATPQSGYDVTITIPDPMAFPVADFTHRNFTVPSPSLTSIVLDFLIDFDVDGVQTGPLTFTFTFTHEETPNNQNPCPYPTPPGEGCTDRVTFLDAPAPTTFTVGGKTYTLGLSFLDSVGNPVDEFITSEGGVANTAELDVAFALVPPVLEVTKSGPATMAPGQSEVFVLDVRNTGPNDAWNATVRDLLPDGATGGMCDSTPQVLSAQVFAVDGVTPIPGKGALLLGTDFSLSYTAAPTCELILTMLSAAAVVSENERLIISYQTQLDGGTQGGVSLTNVAGATEWFDDDASNSGRGIYTRALSTGTVGVIDHEDAHTVTTDQLDYLFEKTVVDPVGGGPLTTAAPGDTLRYQLRLENRTPTPLVGIGFTDEIDRLNGSPLFVPGSLTLAAVPGGADTIGTDPNGGAAGTGVVDVRDLSVAPGGSVLVEFDVTLANPIPAGTLVTDQAELLIADVAFGLSDDPAVNGVADPFVNGDEDPTVVTIGSGPAFRVEKVSTDLDGDPAVLLAGETLRYTITVRNVGDDDAVDAALRDAIPIQTTYVAGSTTLNGVAQADVAGAPAFTSATGLLLSSPDDPTPGVLLAGGSDPGRTATLTFDVVVDPAAADGTIISNQAFVRAMTTGTVDQPSDDPRTPTPDDPTRDVVGNSPLLFAPKQAALSGDVNLNGRIDPGDTIHYTITVFNNGTLPATASTIIDAVPANTTWVSNSLMLNGQPVGVPDGGSSPLASGIAISSSDQPQPAPGGGILTPGESALIEFDLLVDPGVPNGTPISNQATVTTVEVPNLPTDGDGNPSTGPEPTVVVVGDAQTLSITKSVTVVGGGVALANGQLDYEVRVTNVGNVAAQNVVITDDLAAPISGQTTLVGSATLDGLPAGILVSGSVITANWSSIYGELPPGASAVLRFRTDVSGVLAIGTMVTNTGVVTWDTPSQTESSSVTVTLGGIPGLGVVSGAVWHDRDFDRLQGSTERAIASWIVDLYRNGQPSQSTSTDSNGAYQIIGIAPNDLNGDTYEIRFRAPDAGPNTASLGRAESAFNNVLQSISSFTITSGSVLQNLNLPIDPQGVVYDSIQRTPLSGTTLNLVNASNGTPVSNACLDDPNQQGQVTGSDGYYKFDLNFSDPTSCPNPGSYVIETVAPGAGFTSGVSQLIPPLSDIINPFDVPACTAGGGTDAIPATTQNCEIQVSEFSPPTSVAATSAAAGYHVNLTLDDSNGVASSQAFNNHIPVDAAFGGGAVALIKTTPLINVSRGDLVPYTITFTNTLDNTALDLTIIDRYPAGFRYIQGSARLDGVEFEPTISGGELEWTINGVAPLADGEIQLLLGVGAGVTEGEFINRAQAFSGGVAFSGQASATVRVVPDPTFDCTDVIGKVFDDKNRDGYQDEGEPGLAGVRLVTVRGLAVKTDPHGRFHITCAVVPNEERGSNFILKLDDRTLPSGYRMSTRRTQVKRATRGKAVKFEFGAAISRVVGLDLADAVFEPGETEIRTQWKSRISMLLDELAKEEAILRLSYVADIEDPGLVKRRLEEIQDQIEEAWKARGGDDLTIETEIFWRRGAPPAKPNGPSETSALESALPHVGAGPPGLEPGIGHSTERHLSTDEPFTQWSVDPERLDEQIGDELAELEVVNEKLDTVKLTDVVAPIFFDSGAVHISPEYIAQLREVLDNMRDLRNVRLHLVGHADDQALSPALARRFGDNEGLSRERAGEVAEFLQIALNLPPESIAYSWVGTDQPIASNATPEGRAQNRRVEVQVWYDEVAEETSFEEVVISQDIKRVKVCRTETVCKLRYREGHERRARVKNLIPPLLYKDEVVSIPKSFVRQVEEALYNLRNKQNVTAKFIVYTDDVPLTGRAQRIYGNHLAISKARAHRVALEIKDALDLPTSAIASDGRGDTQPVASNATPRGRRLNRRVEVEFWHDDPLLDLPDEPQLCPDPGDAELVTRVYDPAWGEFEDIPIEDGEALIQSDLPEKLTRAMTDVRGELNVRVRFIGYTRNERLTRRMADVYGDDIGLSAARARRTMERIKSQLALTDAQVEHEGRGYVHSEDVVNGGFIQGETSHVVVQVVYDEPAVIDDYEGIEVTPITRELEARDPLALNLMRITVDGEPIDDPGRSSADIQRCTDVALDAAEIQFRFDDLEAERRLSITSVPETVSPGGSDLVRFRMYSNYPHYIERAEVRVFDRDQSLQAKPLAVLPLDRYGKTEWRPGAEDLGSPIRVLKFVVRAYGEDDQFDETAPQPLWMVPNEKSSAGEPEPIEAADLGDLGEAPTSENVLGSEQEAPRSTDTPSSSSVPDSTDIHADRLDASGPSATSSPADGSDGGGDPSLAGYGESEAIAANISLGSAGTIRVQGSGIPPGHTVWLAGTEIPVNEHGEFVGEVLLPAGMNTVEVAVLDSAGNGELFLRDLEIDKNDWFFVGIADLTLSADLDDGRPNELDGNNSTDLDAIADGRLAFFTTGKFGEDWRLTASADTREGPVEDLFTNFLDKSPDALFRRIDPDYHYPTFGDDSTIDQTAPTLGKFYVKLNQRDNHLLWGNFTVRYNENELALVERGLYGANARYQSLATTRHGERRVVVDGFAADPGTVPSREEFRGTGGSVYFLKRQDLLMGSERVRIEIRDKASGLVSEIVRLQPELDYNIDYLQGRILLTEPISSVADDRLLVRNDGLSGNEVYLVVQYEFTPGFDSIDTLNGGGQAHVWLNDFVKFGATASRSEAGDIDSTLYAADLTFRKTNQSWVKIQAGRSDGLVSNTLSSNDGGFTFTDPAVSGIDSDDAFGYRADVSVGLADFFSGAQGRISLYGQRLEAGYSAPGLNTDTDLDQYGAELQVPVVAGLELTAKADHTSQDEGLETLSAEVDVYYEFLDGWNVEAGARHEERNDDSSVVAVTQEEGDRTDAVVQVGFDAKGRWSAYAFGQATVHSTEDREDNNRGGVGGELRVTDRIAVDGEVSHGDLGTSAQVGTTFQRTKQSKFYMNYALDNERGYDGLNERQGSLVVGTRSRLSDSTSVYAENQYQHSSVSGLTRSMGVSYAPTQRWNVSASWEDGETKDRQTSAKTERRGGGASVGYKFDDLSLSSGIEYIFQKIQQSGGSRSDRTTWLFRNNLKYQMNKDGRLIAKFNHAISDSSEGDFFDGGFTEAVVGYAFRPIAHDRFNALAKYTYFYNVPTVDQVGQDGTSSEFIQKSHIASIDLTYDLTKTLTLGAKYAYRLSQVSLDRDDTNFFDNDAHLYILRADWRFLKNWETTVEGRLLDLPDLDERRAGSLVTLYRYFGEHVKAGVGYNFTDFSEDLTDLSYDHHGLFFNILGTF